ncbi:MAG: hypothetical protein KBH93_13185 [Anaerolineae bacterium]|nr:hypothetical protein [Anaerolineae bacterium]
MSKQKKSRRGTPASPRPVEPEMGAAFPEPCTWPLAWHGEALYTAHHPTSPSSPGHSGGERAMLAGDR